MLFPTSCRLQVFLGPTSHSQTAPLSRRFVWATTLSGTSRSSRSEVVVFRRFHVGLPRLSSLLCGKEVFTGNNLTKETNTVTLCQLPSLLHLQSHQHSFLYFGKASLLSRLVSSSPLQTVARRTPSSRWARCPSPSSIVSRMTRTRSRTSRG